jgi:hypothetical protein
VSKLAPAFSNHFANGIKSSSLLNQSLVFTETGSFVALLSSSIILNAVSVFIIRLLPCPLLTTFFAGHHIFTSIQATLYCSMIFAALANISGSFQNI